MKVVIFCGGLGTRFGSVTKVLPKPLIEVAGYPILFHVMNIYAEQGYKEFVLLVGYKQRLIKEWFDSLHRDVNNYTLDLFTGSRELISPNLFDWKITFLDTGVDSNTAYRLLSAQFLLQDSPFFLTYADGISNINLAKLLTKHKQMNKTATLTAVNEPKRLGYVEIRDGNVKNFEEKPHKLGNYVNGGFFVVEPEIFSLPKELFSKNTSWENGPLSFLAENDRLAAYEHNGYWKCMDSERDQEEISLFFDSSIERMRLFSNYD